MPNQNNAASTAAEAYAARRRDIASLIDVLQMELERHHERANAAPRDWGYPGDLASVRSALIDQVAFISGMERGRVEEFLNDAE